VCIPEKLIVLTKTRSLAYRECLRGAPLRQALAFQKLDEGASYYKTLRIRYRRKIDISCRMLVSLSLSVAFTGVDKYASLLHNQYKMNL
jgi:hypothetical protein